MKRFSFPAALLSAALTLATLRVTAQTVPQGISYQAVARTAANAVIANQAVKLRLSVCPNAAGTLPVYVETQTATTSALGLLTLTLGQGTVVSGTFATINWGTGSYWVKTEIDPAGGIVFQSLGTTQLLGVPYALYAKASATPGPTGATGAAGPVGAAGAAGTLYKATSASSFLIGAGSKIFVTQAALAYVPGSRVRVSNSATTWMEGVVTAYVGTSLTVTIDKTAGAGTLAAWTLNLAGETGATGAAGAAGIAGATGVAGPTGAAGAAGTLYKATSASSFLIGGGAKTVVTQTGLAYVPGSRVRLTNSATTWMEGVVTAYAGTSLTVTIDKTAGAGTLAAWTLNLAGEVGAVGVAGATGAAGADYGGTSATSTTLAVGLKTFVTQAGRAYVAGQRVRAAVSPTQYVEGVVTTYAGTNLTLSADRVVGAAGTFVAWTLGLAGDVGATGPAGATGATGAGLTGGLADRLPKYSGASTVALSQITDDGINVGIGAPFAPAYKLDVAGDINTTGKVRVNGFTMLQVLNLNRFLGGAGSSAATGNQNTLIGAGVGTDLTTGSRNVMIGNFSGNFSGLSSSSDNTFVGVGAGYINGNISSSSTALGYYAHVQGDNSLALGNNTRVYGNRSAAIGDNAQVDADDAIVIGAVVSNSDPTAPQTRQPYIGIGTTTPTSVLTVVSNSTPSFQGVTLSRYSGTSAVDPIGVKGEVISTPANYGYGGQFHGNYLGVDAAGYNYGASTTANYFGVRANVIGTGNGSAYAVFASTAQATGPGTKYAVFANGNLACTGTFSNTSDRKLKRNIQPLATGTLGKLMKLRAVSYEMRTDEFPEMSLSTGPQVGVIAQELAEVFPELVKDEAHPGKEKNDAPILYKGVNYTGLTPILIKAVQEQQALIEALTKRIEQLEKAAK
ncbi:MAG: tail fiber domain-containing protein [Hymenobacteraceae bacterium]|nr:tail fiber domain-containing protein [Hymenobacteraceae bacterium]